MPGDESVDSFVFGGKVGGVAPYDTYTANMRPLNRYLDVDNTCSAKIFHCPDDTKALLNDKTSFDYYGTSYYFNGSILVFGEPPNYRQRPLNTITNPRSKVWMEMCIPIIAPGHGGKGQASPNTPVMVLFVDGHVKGPYLYYSEFARTPEEIGPQKPVYGSPNTTE